MNTAIMATIDRSIQYTGATMKSSGATMKSNDTTESTRIPGSQLRPQVSIASKAMGTFPMPQVAVSYDQIVVAKEGTELVGMVRWHRLGFYIEINTGKRVASGGFWKTWGDLESYCHNNGWQIYSA